MSRLHNGLIKPLRVSLALAMLFFVWAPCAIANRAALRAYAAGDRNRAFQLWMQDAKGGDIDAQYHVAIFYRDGEVVGKDPAEAMRWLRRSAEGGFDTSQMELGRFYATGFGVAVDGAEARKWYEKSIAQGNIRAKNLLGLLCLNGRGVPQDYGLAYRLFLEASGEISAAAYNVALMHENGRGRQVDLVEAGAWYSIAADEGEPGAKEKRYEIMRKLSPKQTTQMHSRARDLDFERFVRGMEWNWEETLGIVSLCLVMLQLSIHLIGYFHRRASAGNAPELDGHFSAIAGNGFGRWFLLYRPQNTTSAVLHALFFACLLAAPGAWIALFTISIRQRTFTAAICFTILLPLLRWAAVAVDKHAVRTHSRPRGTR